MAEASNPLTSIKYLFSIPVGTVVLHDGVEKTVTGITDEATLYCAETCYGRGATVLEFHDGTEAFESEFLPRYDFSDIQVIDEDTNPF